MPENETKPVAQGWLTTQDPSKVEAAAATMPAEFAERYGNGDPYFALYLHLADRKCIRAVGVGIFDIADYLWHDAYTGGTTPSQAAREALENDDTLSALFGGE